MDPGAYCRSDEWYRDNCSNLGRPIPVLIVYGTAVVLGNGEIHFFDDIYGLDAQLDQTSGERVHERFRDYQRRTRPTST